MMRFTLMSAAAISAVSASVSTSVFPNSLCQGASDSLGGLVGVGKVTLANGEVEVHCGCPSDNLADFEACPSSQKGESVCNSVYDMSSGRFSAACDVVECSGADCLDTIVNEVVTAADECFNSERGSIGVSTVDGESQCACSSDVDATGFTACEAPANGKATCSTLDPDFLGTTYEHAVQVSCGVVCDEGYTLTLDGTCTKIAKRDYNAINMGPGPVVRYGSSAAGPSKSMGMGGGNGGSSTSIGGMASASSSGWYNNMGSSKGNAMPTTTSVHPHQAHTTSGAGGSMATASSSSYSYKHHNGHKSQGHGAGYQSSGIWAGGAKSSSGIWSGSSSSMMGGNNGGNNGGNMMTTSSGANHNAKPTTTSMGGNNGGNVPTTTSYSYKQYNGQSSMGGGSASSASRLPYWSQVSMAKSKASNSAVHWAHKRDAVPTAAPAYVLKQHNARAPADLHRRASSASGMYMASSSMKMGGGSSSSMKMGGGSSMPMMPMVTPSTPAGSNHAARPTSGAMMGGSSSSSSSSMMGGNNGGNNGGMKTSSTWAPGPSASRGSSASSASAWYQPMPSMGPSGSNHNAHPMPSSSGSASASASSSSMGGNNGGMKTSSSMGGNNGGMKTSSTWAPGPSASRGPSASSASAWYQPAPSSGPSGSNHNSNPSGSNSGSGSGSNNGNGSGSNNGNGSGSNNGKGSGSSSSSMMNSGGAATTSQPMKYAGSSTAVRSAAATPGPSQRVRRASNEYVFSDVCAQDERTCPGDIMCVRLDDVTECGGCHATGDAVNCLEIPGASSVSCLRGGCVVRSCQTGYFQTAEGRCERL